MVPDKERKRSYRMSVGQQRSRTEHEYYESRALNLTLDINDLRQQVMHLLECRDLQITRLLLTRQHVEGEDEDGDTKDTAEVRVICGGAGGCLVEAVGEFKGRFTRDILSSMFPHVLSNEMVVASLIGLSINCPARLLLYFDAKRRIMRQVAQADVFAAFSALQQARPTEFAALMGQA
ncbi:hypothetical protein BBO99_00007424 [Phytophthora kernoviae]|uniref:Uncharacterized protein n=2 Tax=Phytophthora kernoviae TaxID=325452 RepID=A0A3R7ILJ9_9STRA|nr:hypothetical protein G195_008390 [Phytophthora kernoviae 00238/432]KAG2519440.1 hypothetical protein JM16_007090 [Phytophthora kernoviae]KAG2520745.1 hypothetical protein JM18_006957 [Phytophthora kernoviae]RLN32281.1 hypothetical protein BBI17_007379 [Phytophthora kernoviae]RLN76583.1 hypothetical protein BBO99_00007424 [Phytophthora kernoviae]